MPSLLIPSQNSSLRYERLMPNGDGGTDHRLPVLLIMGFGMSGLAWQPQFPLAKEREVVWYDHLGVGESEPLTTPKISMPDMADHAHALIRHLGWTRCHVVGVSMGGMIAQHLALRCSKYVASLSLIATHPGGLKHIAPSVRGLRLFFGSTRGTREERVRKFQELLYTKEFIRDHPEKLVRPGEGELKYLPSKKIRRAQLRAIMGHDTRPNLSRLTDFPTIVMRPEHDVLVRPEGSTYLANAIPRAKLIRFPHAAHGVIRQCADEVNAHLNRHFAGVE